VVESGEYGNEPLITIKDGELLDHLSNCHLLKNSAIWSSFVYTYYLTSDTDTK